MAVTPVEVTRFIGVDSPLVVRLLGAGLLPYGVILAWLASQPQPSRSLARLCTLADAGWVIGTIVLWMVAPAVLSAQGWSVAAVVACVVAVCGLLQAWGLMQTQKGCHAPS